MDGLHPQTRSRSPEILQEPFISLNNDNALIICYYYSYIYLFFCFLFIFCLLLLHGNSSISLKLPLSFFPLLHLFIWARFFWATAFRWKILSLSHFNSLFSLTWVFWALQRGWMGEALVALNSPRLYDYSFLLPASSRRDRRPAEHRGSCSIAANCDEFSTDVFLLVPLQPVSSAFSTTGPPFVFSVLLPSSLPHFFSLIFSEHSWGIVSVMEGSVLVGCASQYVYVGMSVSVCLYDKWNVRRCSKSFWKNDGCQNTLTWKK